MAPSAGEPKEQLYNMPGDDGKTAVGTMGNQNLPDVSSYFSLAFH